VDGDETTPPTNSLQTERKSLLSQVSRVYLRSYATRRALTVLSGKELVVCSAPFSGWTYAGKQFLRSARSGGGIDQNRERRMFTMEQ
jgi:hypothetical protein